MTNDQIKQVEELVAKTEKEMSGPADTEHRMKLAAALFEVVSVMGGKQRTELLRELHQRLCFVLSIAPTKLTQFIVAELASPHALRDNLLVDVGEIRELPEELQGRILKLVNDNDQFRLVGLRRLQAFVKIRPALLTAMEELGAATNYFPR